MQWLKKISTTENLTLAGVISGILMGIYAPSIMVKLKILGDLFLNLLKMIILPLVFISVFLAILRLGNIKKFSDIGTKTVIYYVVTTALAVITGLLLVTIIEPGKGEIIKPSFPCPKVDFKKINFQNIVWSLIPSNPVKSFAQGNILQVIFFSIFLAISVLAIKEEKRTYVYNLFDSLNDAFMILTNGIIRLTPIGVFSLVGHIVSVTGIDIFIGLWKYALTVILGLLIHAFLTLPLLAFTVAKYNPYRYFISVREALLLAFSTASSAATLPVSIRLAENKGNVKPETAYFVLPLGATVNMDGTALYESVAAVFIANIYGIQLGIPQIIMIFLTATLASIGAAAIPSAGLVMLTLVLNSTGIPLEGIGLIIAVDRFLDMLRTSVNVWGDLNGAKIVNKFSSFK
jgi:Na+/H+-dicarboxylate symporter